MSTRLSILNNFDILRLLAAFQVALLHRSAHLCPQYIVRRMPRGRVTC